MGRTLALSNRAEDMPRSSIRRIFNAAKALEEAGEEVVRLDIGDPDFEMPRRIGLAVGEALKRGETHYSPTFGIPPLRRAIAAHLKRRGLDVAQERIVASQGATQALNAVLLACCDAGGSMLYPEIYFPNYIQQSALAGVQPRFYPLGDDFQPDLRGLEQAWRDDLQAILVNSPSNPTGAVFPPETIERLYEFACEKDIWLVSDEAYWDFVFEGDYLTPLALDLRRPPEQRRVFAVFSFSKSFAVTGLRMGWTAAPSEEAAFALGTINEPLMGCLTTPLQWGMVAALQEDDTAVRRRSLKRRRDLAVEILGGAGIETDPPRGGMFLFLDISNTGMDGDAFADALLEERRVAVVPGSGFALAPSNGPGGRLTFKPSGRALHCVRICFAVPEDQLRKGLASLADFARTRA